MMSSRVGGERLADGAVFGAGVEGEEEAEEVETDDPGKPGNDRREISATPCE